MRIALDQHGEVGTRTGRILLGERSLEALGLVGRAPRNEDARLERAADIADYDTLVSDAADEPDIAVRMALAADVDCVIFADGDAIADRYGPDFEAADRTLLVGANVAAGIAPALASHETARGGEILEVSIAWTEPGSPIRKGEAIPFPEPVGARWARPRPTEPGYVVFAAPVPGPWAGAIARVTSATPGGVVTRIVGVADLAAHLEALALAAAAMAIDVYAAGAHRPAWAAEAYLAAALGAGLDVAAYSLERG